MTAIRVLIVDDKPQVRQDLRMVLTLVGEAAQDRPIEIVGEAGEGRQAIRQAAALNPEVILMDLEMPVLDGYAATQEIKASSPGCRVIALSVHDYEAARQRASQAGVDEFIVKGAPVETLVRAMFAQKD